MVVNVINSLKNQNQIAEDCVKQLIPLTIDSNPFIRRISLITIVNFIKNQFNRSINLIGNQELNEIICKYLNDPHPIVIGTAFFAITELKNKDYLNLNFAENFTKFCSSLILLEEFYLSRAVFSLVNFSKLFLFNNIEKNFKYIRTFLNCLYQNLKRSTDFSKNITYLSAIYEIIIEFDKQNFNVLLKEEFNIFKNKKRLQKLANMLVRIYQSSKNKSNETIIILDLISKYVNFGNSSLNKNEFLITCIDKNKSEYFLEIKSKVCSYVNEGIFFLKATDKPFIVAKKLEIIVNLADEENIRSIFEEFKRILDYPLIQRKKLIIKAIYFICKLNSSYASNNLSNLTIDADKENSNKIPRLCVEKLIDCLKMKEEVVISEVIISLRKLVNEIEYHTKYILIYCIKNFKYNISSNSAKANIIWMICKYMHLIPTVTADFFRRILIDLESENDEVKSQIINLALKLHFSCDFVKSKFTQEAEFMGEKLKALVRYCLEKLFFDQNYHIREKARLAQMLMTSENVKFLNDLSLTDLNSFENYMNDFSNNNTTPGKNKNFQFFFYQEKKRKDILQDEKESEDMRLRILKEKEKNSNFNLSLSFRMGINKTTSEHGIKENQENNNIDNLFFFDFIEDHIDENFYSISLDDIINVRKSEAKTDKNSVNYDHVKSNEGKILTNQEKFKAVKSQEEKVKSTVENFDSKVNVEETRNTLKNKLDAFLNENDDQDEDEFEVEINKD